MTDEEITRAADEYVETHYPNANLGYCHWQQVKYKDCFIAGAKAVRAEMKTQGLALQSDMDKTIAQNMALKEEHRWHYPNKGELPEEGLLVLCYRKTADGYRYRPCQQFHDSDWYDEYMDILETDELPIAWQYLLDPPKEDSV